MHLSLQYGWTPLIVASFWGHVGCVQHLLDRGAQIDHQNEVSAFRDQPSVNLYNVQQCNPDVCGTCTAITTGSISTHIYM